MPYPIGYPIALPNRKFTLNNNYTYTYTYTYNNTYTYNAQIWRNSHTS